MSYQLSLLDSNTASSYIGLTYPRLQQFLSQLGDDSKWIAVGLSDAEQPVGLAVGKIAASLDNAKLGTVYSLFVIPEKRQQGLGTALLQAIEDALIQKGCTKFCLEYLESSTSSGLEKILQRQAWSEPESIGMIAHNSDVRRAVPIVERFLKCPLPEGYRLFRWNELTDGELETLRKSWLKSSVVMASPFTEESCIEPLNSIGLKCHGRIVGWMITHRLAPDLIRYTTLHVEPDQSPLSRGLTLMSHALKIQIEESDARRAIFNVNHEHTPAMARLVERRFSKWLDPLRYRFEVTKVL